MSSTTRVALVQVRVDASRDATLPDRLARLDRVLADARLAPGSVDLVCLPEACCSPYLFRDERDAADRAQPALQRELAIEHLRGVARRLRCGVAAGLVLDAESSPSPSPPSPTPPPRATQTRTRPRNVYVVIDPDGNVLLENSKFFLYVTDKLWADEPRPDEAFRVVELAWLPPGAPRRFMFAVCNDINSSGESDFAACPLGAAAARERADVVALLTAWCSQGPDASAREHDADVDPMDQVEYWAARMLPLVGSGAFFVAADRVGREPIPGARDAARIHYCGSSCAIEFPRRARGGASESDKSRAMARVIDVADAESETVVVVELARS